MRQSWPDDRLDDFRAETGRRFDEVDRRFEEVNRRFDRVETEIKELGRDLTAGLTPSSERCFSSAAPFWLPLLGL